jgi:hypothetical protein
MIDNLGIVSMSKASVRELQTVREVGNSLGIYSLERVTLLVGQQSLPVFH